MTDDGTVICRSPSGMRVDFADKLNAKHKRMATKRKTKQGKADNKMAVIHERITTVFLMLAFGLYPLVVGLHGYSDISTAKWTAFLAAFGGYCVISIVLFAELCIVGKTGFKNKKPARIISYPLICAFVFLFISIFSTIFAIDRSFSFWGGTRHNGLFTLGIYIVSFFLLAICGQTARLGQIALTFAGISITVCCIIAVLQLAGLNPLKLYPEGLNYYDAFTEYTAAFLGTIGNVDLLSALLSMAVPAFVCALVVLKDGRRFLLLIPLIFSLYVLFCMSVAGGIVGTLGAVILLPPVLMKDRKKRIIATVCVVVLIFLGLVSIYLWGIGFGGTFAEASELLHGNFDDRFGSGRIYIWRTLLPLVTERPLLGGGPDSVAFRSTADFVGIDYYHEAYMHSVVDNAHNEYLGVLINQGILGILSYFSLLISSFVVWVRTAPHSAVSAICGSAVAGYCIQAFFNVDSHITTIYMWLLLGLLCGAESSIDDTAMWYLEKKNECLTTSAHRLPSGMQTVNCIEPHNNINYYDTLIRVQGADNDL